MQSQVSIIFNSSDRKDYEFFIHNNSDEAQEAARTWFADKWVELECEPIRQSGKVLLLDRILSVVDGLGHYWFEDHPEEAQALAEKAVLALDSPVVVIDLPGASISSN